MRRIDANAGRAHALSTDEPDFRDPFVALSDAGAEARDLLLRNKRAVNRLQDQLDVERLTRET